MKKAVINNSLKTVLGPLWKLYSDDKIRTICIDAFDDVYYFQKNESKEDTKIFKSEKELDSLVSRLAKYAGVGEPARSIYLNIDQLTNIDIVLRPIAIRGASIIINKLPMQEVTLEDLVKFSALDNEGKNLILKYIKEGKGILVAGNAGSGKTTLLNTIVNAIPQPMRVVTVERFADLVINRKKVCRLQAYNQKTDEMIELVSIAERMLPDYVVNSNFEGPEVMPFLEMARNNCSAIGLITAQNPLDALKRLETKAVLSSEGMSLEDARYAISQSFKNIVFQEKCEDGRRLVSSIGELQFDAGELKLKIIYKGNFKNKI